MIPVMRVDVVNNTEAEVMSLKKRHSMNVQRKVILANIAPQLAT